ncbi:hypothetical protein S7711_10543 [Stachybotrys chartarum IBT 7711]|uniref:Uncharacterized protein n=1 Tax=Stachybotrys chartarum (strain CBS 109288 / IBT 7711) TaxID=1280523 RepID=A0A084AW44_STACB|nr:hypothetical protein S7711_10543 [Stachybotrys chartarum IBT 7711]KFA53313.1 hypothetical protein S40293_10839 [Stachybotrys chartarum IBT 40293]
MYLTPERRASLQREVLVRADQAAWDSYSEVLTRRLLLAAWNRRHGVVDGAAEHGPGRLAAGNSSNNGDGASRHTPDNPDDASKSKNKKKNIGQATKSFLRSLVERNKAESGPSNSSHENKTGQIPESSPRGRDDS